MHSTEPDVKMALQMPPREMRSAISRLVGVGDRLHNTTMDASKAKDGKIIFMRNPSKPSKDELHVDCKVCGRRLRKRNLRKHVQKCDPGLLTPPRLLQTVIASNPIANDFREEVLAGMQAQMGKTLAEFDFIVGYGEKFWISKGHQQVKLTRVKMLQAYNMQLRLNALAGNPNGKIEDYFHGQYTSNWINAMKILVDFHRQKNKAPHKVLGYNKGDGQLFNIPQRKNPRRRRD